MMAKQILATPVSIVAVEQQFSAGSNILDPTRSSMSPYSIEAQAYLDDWTKAEFRQQEQEHEQTYKFLKMSKQPAQKGAMTSFVIVWLQLPINRYKNYVGFDSSKLQEDT